MDLERLAAAGVDAMTERGAPRLDARHVAKVAAVALAYFAAAELGLSLAFSVRQVTALWPPTGIAVAALLLWGYRIWPGIYLGSFAANVLKSDSILVPAMIGVGNTLGPVILRYALSRLGASTAFASSRDVLYLILCAPLGMVVTATLGVATLCIAGGLPWSAYTSVWQTWWVGDVMGVLVFAPLILSWAVRPRLLPRGLRLLELCALFAGVLLVSLIALAGEVIESGKPLQLQYAVFPFIIWASLRFGIRETAMTIALVTGVAVLGATHKRGPFTAGNPDEQLILLQLLIATAAVTGYLLSTVSSERTRAREALQRANDELESGVQQRTAELAAANTVLAQRNEEVEAFVYIVSHDLRVPLVNLQGFAKELDRSYQELVDVLQAATAPLSPSAEKIQTILREDVATALRYISASTTKFQRLIDALLLLSRTGRDELQRETIDVQALVDTTLLTLRQSVDNSGADVLVDDLPPAVGDTTAIGQVFSNLISNALKYLQPGRPGRIEIDGELQDGVAHYRITDNGVGIPESARRRLFQVFQRFHPELAPGEGMGLAIVKRIVERHGGKVWVDSEPGVGTTFHVTLPAPMETRKE